MEIVIEANNLAITQAEADIYSEMTGRRYSYGKYISLIRPKLSASEYKKIRNAAEKRINDKPKPTQRTARRYGLLSFFI